MYICVNDIEFKFLSLLRCLSPSHLPAHWLLRDINFPMNFVLHRCASDKIGPHVEILILKEHNYRWEMRRARDQFLAARKNRVFVRLLCYFLVIVGGKGQISGRISRLLYFLVYDIFILDYVLRVLHTTLSLSINPKITIIPYLRFPLIRPPPLMVFLHPFRSLLMVGFISPPVIIASPLFRQNPIAAVPETVMGWQPCF